MVPNDLGIIGYYSLSDFRILQLCISLRIALDPGPGAWSLEPGAWSLGPGAWSLEPRAWNLEPGNSVPGGSSQKVCCPGALTAS